MLLVHWRNSRFDETCCMLHIVYSYCMMWCMYCNICGGGLVLYCVWCLLRVDLFLCCCWWCFCCRCCKPIILQPPPSIQRDYLDCKSYSRPKAMIYPWEVWVCFVCVVSISNFRIFNSQILFSLRKSKMWLLLWRIKWPIQTGTCPIWEPWTPISYFTHLIP